MTNHTHAPKIEPSPYDDAWYEEQITSSYKSAKIYVSHLRTVFDPKSVVDVGCGRGAWLKAFHDSGAESLVGIDGFWNSQAKMIDQKIRFHSVDLNKSISLGDQKFDLALSLEVAEHLRPDSAKVFIDSLTSLSNTIIFGAAYIGQGGTDHLNEQPHNYWAELFDKLGYAPYDFFRPSLWGNDDVAFWYRQNTFLYVRRNTDEHRRLSELGYNPIQCIDFMNCIHPSMYEKRLSEMTLIRRFITPLNSYAYRIIPKRLLPVARRLKRAFFKPTQQQL